MREPGAFDTESADGDREALSPPQTVEPRPEPVELPAWLLEAMQQREAETEPGGSRSDAVVAEAASPEGTAPTRDDGGRRADGLAAPRAYFDEPASQQRGKGGGGDGRQRYVLPGGRVPGGGARKVPVGDPAAAVRVRAPDWAVVDLGGIELSRRATPGWEDAGPTSSSGPVTTPSSPPAADGRVCPCDCVCVPAPATGADFAILPGYGASGPNFLAPPLMVVDAAKASEIATAVAMSPGATAAAGSHALSPRRTTSGDATPTAAVAAGLAGAFATGVAVTATPGMPVGPVPDAAAGRAARSSATGHTPSDRRGLSSAAADDAEALGGLRAAGSSAAGSAQSLPSGVGGGSGGRARGAGLLGGMLGGPLGSGGRGPEADDTRETTKADAARGGAAPAKGGSSGGSATGGEGAAGAGASSKRGERAHDRDAQDGKKGGGKKGDEDGAKKGGGGGGRWSGPSGPRGEDLAKSPAPIGPPGPTSRGPAGPLTRSPPLHPHGSPGSALHIADGVLAGVSAPALRLGDRSPRVSATPLAPPRHPALAPGGTIRSTDGRRVDPPGSATASPTISPGRAWELEHLMGGGDARTTPTEDPFSLRDATRPKRDGAAQPPARAPAADPDGAGTAPAVPDGVAYAGARVRAAVPAGGGVRGIGTAPPARGHATTSTTGSPTRVLAPGGLASGVGRGVSSARSGGLDASVVLGPPSVGTLPAFSTAGEPRSSVPAVFATESRSPSSGPAGSAVRPGGLDLEALDDTGIARGRGGGTLSAAANAALVADGLSSEAQAARRSAMSLEGRLDAVEEAYARLATTREAAGESLAERAESAGGAPSEPQGQPGVLEAIDTELGALREAATALTGAALAADEQARALATAASRAEFDRGRLVAQLKAAVPGRWKERLEEEVARQTSPSAQDRARRDAFVGDAVQRGAVRRMEARGDTEVSRAAGSLDRDVEARRSALARELDAHAMRYAALDRLDALQAEIADRVARGEADSGVRTLGAKLAATAPQRHAERIRHLRRDARQAAALIRRLGRLAARRDRQGRSDEADALRSEIAALEEAVAAIGVALALLEGTALPVGARAPRAPVDWRVPAPLVSILPDTTGLAAKLSAMPPTSTAAPTTSVLAPSGSALGDEVKVSLDPRYLGFDVIGWGAPQGFHSTSSGTPLSPPQITLEDGTACPSPPCCPPGMCAEGEACQCRPRSASGGAKTPDGVEPTDPDRPGGTGGGGDVGRGVTSGGGAGGRSGGPGGRGGGGRFVEDDEDVAPSRSRPGVLAPSGSAGPSSAAEAPEHGPLDAGREGTGRRDPEDDPAAAVVADDATTEPVGPVVTITEESIRVGPPETSPLGQGRPLTEADDLDELSDPENPVYRSASGGFEALYETSVANRDSALGAAALANERMGEVSERAQYYADRARRMRDAADELRDRRRDEDSHAYDGWIEHLDRQHAEARAMERALHTAWTRYRDKRDRYLDDFERFDAEVGGREPTVRRDRAYAKFGAGELFLRGLVDLAVGATGLDAVLPIPELLPDGSARGAGGVVGLLLGGARAVGGAARVATSTLKGVRAAVAAERLAEAAKRIRAGASALKALRAARAVETAKDLLRALESGYSAAAAARSVVGAARSGAEAARVASRVRVVERGAAGVAETFGASARARPPTSKFAATAFVGGRTARTGEGLGALGGRAGPSGRAGTTAGSEGAGVSRIAGAAEGQGGRLVHLTTPEREALIRESGTLIGRPGRGLYAFEGPSPISASRRRIGGLSAAHSAEVEVPNTASAAFHEPPLTGIWNYLRRGAGVRVAPGSVDLAAGKFIPYATGKWSWLTRTREIYIAVPDAALTTGVVGAAGYAAYEGGKALYKKVAGER